MPLDMVRTRVRGTFLGFEFGSSSVRVRFEFGSGSTNFQILGLSSGSARLKIQGSGSVRVLFELEPGL